MKRERETYSTEETETRFKKLLRTAFSMKPQPHKDIPKKEKRRAPKTRRRPKE